MNCSVYEFHIRSERVCYPDGRYDERREPLPQYGFSQEPGAHLYSGTVPTWCRRHVRKAIQHFYSRSQLAYVHGLASTRVQSADHCELKVFSAARKYFSKRFVILLGSTF